ncbi:MAG: hypothetical protein KF725_16715 [Cyclobacteriaceae bacterium]|nr:hypothetical protein [Cyclobacteriaceae bacterium]UYN87654.1 MAG: hypothetical protein KIT51_05180 [Cyclobacteriaceae bacterium]
MIKYKTIWLIVCAAVVMIVYYSCSSSHQQDEHYDKAHGPLANRLRAYTDSIEYEKSSLDAMQQVRLVLAQIHDTVAVLLPERTSMIRSYPCSNCHTQPLAKLSAGRKADEKKSHWDISIIHGSAEVMNCQTCHDEKNMNELVSLTGNAILFDESYKQCRQCHSTQYTDWVGGSHGKRLGGWMPPRIMNTCVSCHNPHKPAFESRWPSRLNTSSLTE